MLQGMPPCCKLRALIGCTRSVAVLPAEPPITGIISCIQFLRGPMIRSLQGRPARALVTAILLGGLMLPASLHDADRARAASGFQDQGTFTYTSGGVVADLDP